MVVVADTGVAVPAVAVAAAVDSFLVPFYHLKFNYSAMGLPHSKTEYGSVVFQYYHENECHWREMTAASNPSNSARVMS